MAYNSITASAPGSMMLFGEHAVLEGHTAIAMAIAERLSVTITTRQDTQLHIQSALGQYQTTLDALTIEKPFQFILGVFQQYHPQLTHGFNITIVSSFSHLKGFGSSAAVTVALVAALDYSLLNETNKETIFLISRKIIQQVQGRGSGADALASTMGAVVAYQMHPLNYQVMPVALPITLVYCGYKTATPKVIQHVNAKKKQAPQRINALFTEMHQIAEQAILALKQNNLSALGKLMQAHQTCQRALGVSDKTLDSIIETAQNFPIYGAKISGSGLGDCVAILGDLPAQAFPTSTLKHTEQIPVKTDLQGVIIHDAK